MAVKFIIIFSTFISVISAIYINPYSFGSYDPAAENPYVYQYYARYYNPNPHNPYAPYPTFMKPGFFRLPRMYQIDPAWVIYYPGSAGKNINLPNTGNYLSTNKNKKMNENPESIATFLNGCEIVEPNGNENAIFGQQSKNLKRISQIQKAKIQEPETETELLLENLEGQPNGVDYPKTLPLRPKWSDTAPTEEQIYNYGKPVTLVRPRVPRTPQIQQTRSSSIDSETISSTRDLNEDFDRLQKISSKSSSGDWTNSVSDSDLNSDVESGILSKTESSSSSINDNGSSSSSFDKWATSNNRNDGSAFSGSRRFRNYQQ